MDALTSAGRVIAAEIAASGPIPFSRFMEVALYHPQHGYYRHARDPFGKEGDFYTAEQLQPVFGRVMRSAVLQLAQDLSAGDAFEVLEVGAGRREMEEAFAGVRFTTVDVDYGALPDRVSGVVFSNELFDAIPVDLIVSTTRGVFERRVGFADGRFVWDDSVPAQGEFPEGVHVRETQHLRLAALERIASSLQHGFILTIDYGYTHRELVRFPEGTLMSYRRHRAMDDVLARPGEQDITAHVDFTALQHHGRDLGLETVRFESLASFLLRAGEADSFASALAAPNDAEGLRLRMQLKALLFGMGETFRVLLQRK